MSIFDELVVTLRRYMAMAKQTGPETFSDMCVVLVAGFTLLLFCYASHCTYVCPANHSFIISVTGFLSFRVVYLFCLGKELSMQVASEAYSSPSIVLQAKGPGDTKIIFDDFREAYRWLSQNTGDNEIVMSWWDYGYLFFKRLAI